MGNTTSTTNKKSLEHVVNYLAAQYITKDEFKNMVNLNNPEYCNEIIILTSKIFKEYLNPKVIEYLAVKKGVQGENVLTKDQIIAIQKDSLDTINVKDGQKRERLCVGLAKFYIQIGHIFSAISSTLNPQYQFKDSEGNLTEQSITEREGLPTSTERIITRNNLCSNRLKILLGSIDYSDILDEETIKINPNFCDINGTSGDKSLDEEPGIPELKQLYYDEFNYNIAKFDGMSEDMKKIYKKDVETLYNEFSDGEKKYDANVIENFSDIKLKDFYNASGCSSGKFKNEVVGSSKKGLFKKYADNIKTMVNNIKTQNDKLLGIIDQLFVFSVDSATGNKKVSINPVLNEQKLSEITKQTRDIILDLYTGCENNFIEGLKIYEAIIRNQQFETTKSQIDNLKTAVGEKLPELGEDLNTLSTNKTQEQDENEDEDENLKTPEDQENQDLKTPEDKENQDLKTPEDQENQDLKTPEDQENQDDKIESPENQESKTNDDIKSQKENQSGILENMLNTIKNTVTEDKKVEQEINTVKSSHQNETMKNSLSLDSEINKTEPSLTDKIKTYKTQKMNEPKLQDQSNE